MHRFYGLPAMAFKKIHANSFPSSNDPFHIKVNCGNERGGSHAFKAATDILFQSSSHHLRSMDKRVILPAWIKGRRSIGPRYRLEFLPEDRHRDAADT
jgi:hypothetical protein